MELNGLEGDESKKPVLPLKPLHDAKNNKSETGDVEHTEILWKFESSTFINGMGMVMTEIIPNSNSGKSVLHVAACSDNGFMEVLLDNEHIRGHMNAPDLQGVTPLMEAVACGNVSAVRLLLATGASTDPISYYSRQNVLHMAVLMNKQECLEELLKQDSSLDILDATDDNGNSPLMLCAPLTEQHNCALSLLHAGADVELTNPNTGRNVLHMAILESNKNLVGELLNASSDLTFLNKADAFGDTSLRLAVRMDESAIIKMLLSCSGAQELVWEFPEVAQHAISVNDVELFAQVLPMFENDELMTWTDSQGRTALMVAVELGRTQMIKDLFSKGVQASLLRDIRGESVLHKAVASGDMDIVRLLLEGGNVKRLINLRDFSGRSALETALASERLECFALLWKSGIFPNKPLNSKLETALFLAAKHNNYGSFLLLLMSPRCIDYVTSLLHNEPVSDVDLERAYLQEHIHASDLYIMTGKKEKNPEWNFCPPQSFQPTANGRTVFHACALGGFYEVISFFYRFCEIFYPTECAKIDQPDNHGSTPLLLACQCDHKEIAKFFLLKGANLCKENDDRESPLTNIYKNVSHHAEFMEEILSNSIVSDGWTLGDETADHTALVVNFSLLCPKGEPYIRVISKIFQTYRDFDDSDLLLHPLLQFYVLLMLTSVGVFLRMRYWVGVANAFAFTAYIVMKYCSLVPEIPFIMWSLYGLSLVFFVLSGIWSLPLTFIPMAKPLRWFEGKALMVPSVLGILYLLFLNGNDRTSLEVAASAALLVWMALLSFSVGSPLRRQKAMFRVVFASMYPYLPVYLLVTGGFCFYFYVIFHDYFAFTNPFHSLLFSAFQLPRGDLGLIPVLTDKNKPIRGTNSVHFSITKDGSDPNDPVTIDSYQELRAMLVEGTALILFLIVSTTITNLLTALAVKSGDEIALSGDVYELASQVDRLEKWELFVFGKPFSHLRKAHLLWLLCVRSSARERFIPPKQAYPLESKPKNFELFMIKNHFTKRQDLISNRRVRLFLEWYFSRDKLFSYPSNHSSFNKMFLEV